MYGPGAEVYPGMIGLTFSDRVFIVFGDGRSELPLVHVDNVVDAIVKSIGTRRADNQVFNVVDADRVTKKMYMERIVKPQHPKAIVIYCPIPVLLAATWLQEKIAAILGRRPFLTVYRLVSSQKRLRYSTSKIENTLGWRPRISFEQAVRQLTRAL
jgi:nucleoside-diphosphate-sugar epimerase